MELSKAMFLQNMLARSKTFVTGEEGALAKTASQAPSSSPPQQKPEHFLCLLQWFSECSPWTTASASPENWLEMQIKTQPRFQQSILTSSPSDSVCLQKLRSPDLLKNLQWLPLPGPRIIYTAHKTSGTDSLPIF
jgi:hypothetical protein